MRRFRLQTIGLNLLGLAFCLFPFAFAEDPRPPWQRLLTGDDAKQARRLNEQIAQHEAADHYEDAITAAEELLALRKKLQGEDHWEAVNERARIAALRKVQALPEPERVEWLESGAEFSKAMDLDRKGKYAEAGRLFQKTMDLRRKVLGDEHSYTAISCLNLAHCLNAQGKNAEAAQLCQKSLATCRKVLGDEHPNTASCCDALGAILDAQGKHTEARPLYQNALDIRRKLLGEEHHDTATSYNNVAFNLMKLGKYAEATAFLEKALEIYRKVLGEQHALTAIAYNNLATNLNFQGKYSDAEPLYQKALDINLKLFGEEHPATATNFNNLAQNLNAQGKYVEAEPLYRKALDIRRKLFTDEHPATAESYSNLAVNLHARGRSAEAALLFQKALDIFQKTLSEEHPVTARSYSNLGGLLNEQGKYAEARPLNQKALEICRKLQGDDHADLSQCCNNLARTLDGQGKYAEAGPLYQKALDIVSKAYGDEHHTTAAAHNNMGNHLYMERKFTEAAGHYQKALAIYRRVLGNEHPDTATSCGCMAANLNALGKYAEAGQLFQEALEISRKALGGQHPMTAQRYSELATNLWAQGNHTEAHKLLQTGLDIRRQVLGDDHPETAISFNNLAANLMAQGKYQDALVPLEAGIRSREACRLAGSKRSVERSLAIAGNPWRLSSAAHARCEHPAEAWSALESALARGLLDEASARRGNAGTADERKRRQELVDLLQRQGPRILQLTTARATNDTQRRELENLLTERRDLEKELTDLAVTVSSREVASLPKVQAALPADSVLIYWLDVADSSDAVNEHWVCLLRSKGEPHWELLPGTGDHNKWTQEEIHLASKFSDALAQTASAETVAKLAARLNAQRLTPVEKHLQGVKQMFVVGVNDMAGVPVELLTDKYTVSYTPSGTYLVNLQEKKRPGGEPTLLALGDPMFEAPGLEPAHKPLPPGGLLILQVVPGSNAARGRLAPGDVLLEYAGQELKAPDQLKDLIAANAKEKSVTVKVWRETEKEPAQRDLDPGPLGVAFARDPAPQAIADRRKTDALLARLRGGTYKELPGTRVELHRLGKLFGEQATLLADSQASERKLKELADSKKLRDYRYLHFATHGQANNVTAFESMLVLAQDDPPKDLPRPGEWYLNGELTANKVLEYITLNADLVTLSACESALGRSVDSEGLLGFAQAFLLAGSRSVCLTLWKVDDTATALLMDRFYQNLLGKRDGLKKPMPKAEALAEAKRWLRELSEDEAVKVCAAMTNGVARGKGQKALELLPEVPKDPDGKKGARPYAHPGYWAAFILIGDPE